MRVRAINFDMHIAITVVVACMCARYTYACMTYIPTCKYMRALTRNTYIQKYMQRSNCVDTTLTLLFIYIYMYIYIYIYIFIYIYLHI